MGNPPPSSPQVSAVMSRIRSRDTGPEMAIRRILHARGLRYRVDMPIPVEPKCSRADIVFTRARLAVYVDGCFWHRCPEHGTSPKANAEWWQAKLDRNVRRDRQTDRTLTDADWRVIRIWEHEDPSEAAERIIAALSGSQSRSP